MFDSVARRYDVVNALLSFGLDRRWRRAVARSLAVRPGDTVLDLGCGTGGLAGSVMSRSATRPPGESTLASSPKAAGRSFRLRSRNALTAALNAPGRRGRRNALA